MKLSNYNFILDNKYNNKNVIYNSLTNAMASIEDEKLEDMLNLNLDIEEDLRDSLLHGGFWIVDDFDEIGILRDRLYESRYNDKDMGLTITPTVKCNFKCPYCYEQGEKPGKMSESIQNKIISLIDESKETLDSLSITWYGGEPLLEMEVIEKLSIEILKICEDENIDFDGYVVTNGYLLSKEVCRKLSQNCRVKGLQITIDGPPEKHNKTRILHDGGGTFHQIIENIKIAQNYFEDISIRVNVSKDNYETVNELAGILEKEGLNQDNISLYYARVDSKREDCNVSNTLTIEEFDYIESKLSDSSDRVDSRLYYPSPVFNYCTADRDNAIVISSDGYLYKCWEDVGYPNEAIGHLEDKLSLELEEKFAKNKTRFLEYDPTKSEKCSACKMLPICMGGCPRKRLNNGEELCLSYKYDFLNRLENAADYYSKAKINKDEN